MASSAYTPVTTCGTTLGGCCFCCLSLLLLLLKLCSVVFFASVVVVVVLLRENGVLVVWSCIWNSHGHTLFQTKWIKESGEKWNTFRGQSKWPSYMVLVYTHWVILSNRYLRFVVTSQPMEFHVIWLMYVMFISLLQN